ncbi:MAG: hypothetical protein VX288_08280, partial [Planctomycetota bacterium]|nr:hypothetical protein [Planctomycetota bacterium]
MLKVTCKGCGANYKAPDDFAGRKIRCKACSEVMLVGEDEAPPSPPPVEAEAPQEAAPAEAEVSQEAAPAEKKAPGKKKISFKKGGIKARKGEKKYSFTKGGGSKKAADPEAGDRKAYGGGKKSGSKKSPAVLVLALLLVVGGLAALDYFALHMVLGKTPVEKQQENLRKFANDLEKNKEALVRELTAEFEQAIEEGLAPEATEPETAAGSEESAPTAEEPAEDLAEKSPALAEIPATGSDALSYVPADMGLVVGLNVPRLIKAYESISGENFRSEWESQPGVPAVVNILDPLNSIEKVTIATQGALDLLTRTGRVVSKSETFSGEELVESETRVLSDPKVGALAILEGQFKDPAKIIEAMVAANPTWNPEPVIKGGLNFYALDEAAELSLAFLSRGQILFVTAPLMEKVVALSKDEGKSITSNEVFNGLTSDFSRKEAAWLVATLPKEVSGQLGELAGGLGGGPGGLPGAGAPGDDAPAPAIKIDSLMLALDSGGTDFALEFVGATPSPEDAENTQKTIGTQLGGLSLMAMQMLGSKALGLMGKLTPKAEDKNVIISFKLNEKEIVTIREMVEKAFSGFAAPGPGDKGFELPEGLDPSDFEEAPEPAEPAAPGDEAEAVDPGQEPEEAGSGDEEAEAGDSGQEPA